VPLQQGLRRSAQGVAAATATVQGARPTLPQTGAGSRQDADTLSFAGWTGLGHWPDIGDKCRSPGAGGPAGGEAGRPGRGLEEGPGREGGSQGGQTPTGVRLEAPAPPSSRHGGAFWWPGGEGRPGASPLGGPHSASAPLPLVMRARHGPRHGRHARPWGGSEEAGRRQGEAERTGHAGSEGRQGPCPLQSKSSRDRVGGAKEEAVEGPRRHGGEGGRGGGRAIEEEVVKGPRPLGGKSSRGGG